MGSITCKNFDPFHRCHVLNAHRADYADDKYIEELMAWHHPFANNGAFQYTEEENMVMLRLPRKECEHFDCKALYGHLTCSRRPCQSMSRTRCLSDPVDTSVFVCV